MTTDRLTRFMIAAVIVLAIATILDALIWNRGVYSLTSPLVLLGIIVILLRRRNSGV